MAYASKSSADVIVGVGNLSMTSSSDCLVIVRTASGSSRSVNGALLLNVLLSRSGNGALLLKALLSRSCRSIYDRVSRRVVVVPEETCLLPALLS